MKKWIGLIIAITGIGAILAGCGARGGAKYADKQELNLSADAPLDTIDLSKANGFGQTGNVFESLFRLGEKGKVTPGLASKTEVSKDGMTYTFTIRKDAKFSDGSKVTADDFVYSWRRTLTPSTKAQYAYLFEGIKNADKINAGKMKPEKLGVEAPNKSTFVVHLDRPMTYFKVLMSYPLFSPISKKAVDKYGSKYATKSQYMVYTGPFKITGWNGTGDHWSFVKNNKYWDKKAVHLDKVNYSVNGNPQTRLNLYQSKKIDMTQLSSQQVKNYKNNKDYVTQPYSITMFLQYNMKTKSDINRRAMNNKNIRYAISLAVDRKQLLGKVIGDASTTSKGLVATNFANNPKTKQDFAKEAYLKGTVDYDAAKAKEYWNKGLKELGVKKLNLELLSDNEGDDQAISQFYGSQLEKILPGLKMTLTNIPSQVAYSRATKGDFDIYVSHWGADFNDPISYLQILQSHSGYNYGKWNNKDYDALVNKAQGADANDPEKRWNDMIKAEQVVMKEQAVSPMYQTVFSYLQNPKIKGIIHNTAGTQWSYKYAYVAK